VKSNTKRTTRRESASTGRPLGLSQQRRRLSWLAIALGVLVAACNGATVTTSLPPPPIPSVEVDAVLIQLTPEPPTPVLLTPLEQRILIHWQDEQERYFEGVECWLNLEGAKEAGLCTFE